MDEGESSDFNEARAELFEALGHKTRVKILQELGRKPMGFSELRRNVELESSGLLSFHLRKLTHLVKLTQEGNYALSDEGKEALGVIGTVREQGPNGGIRHSTRRRVRLATGVTVGALVVIGIIVLASAISGYQNSINSLQGDLAAQRSASALQQQRIDLLQNLTSFFEKEIGNGSLVPAGCSFPFFPTPSLRIEGVQARFLTFNHYGLWVSEFAENSTGYPQPSNIGWVGLPISITQSANNVFTGFPPISVFNGSLDANKTFYQPAGIEFQTSALPSPGLWIADPSNDRVLLLQPDLLLHSENSAPGAFGNHTIAAAIGQTLPYGASSATSMFVPMDVAVDPSGNLWVADFGNSRILEFRPPFSSGMAASIVIGKPSFNLNSIDSKISSGIAGIHTPWALTFDSNGNLWVSDWGNNRVLEFRAPFSTGMNASLVLGQANFKGTGSGASAGFGGGMAELNGPRGIAFDQLGNLWVADTGNNRVIEFTPPFSSGMGASNAVGQPGPVGIAFDQNGDLWVASGSISEYLCGSR